MLKTAVILFVKNEVDDISSWIAWHFHCGFSTIIIYDDNSTDGTWEVINEVAQISDVRPRRAIAADQFNIRQKLTYIDTLTHYREEFDWLLFLDSDEYLEIRDGSPVQKFLEAYPEASAIALNWCCFGSNKQVIKPPTPVVFEHYTARSDPDFEYNYTVKSFIRPKETKPVYINPHRFEVQGRYVTTDHHDVQWKDDHPDRTRTLAQWDIARVHHYVIRSAQHYIEKMQRRVDIRESGMGLDLFYHCDRNQHQDVTPAERTDGMMSWLYDIQTRINRTLFDETVTDRSLSSRPAHDIEQSLPLLNRNRLSLHTLHTAHGTIPCRERGTGRLCHVANPEHDPRVEPILAVSATLWPDTIFLTTSTMSHPLFASGDPRVSTILSFHLERCANGNVALRNPTTGLLACFVGTDDLKNSLVINRSRLQSWEQIDMSLTGKTVPSLLSDVFSVLDTILDPSLLFPVKNPNLTANIFASAVTLLPRKIRSRWNAQHPLSGVPWIQTRTPLSV